MNSYIEKILARVEERDGDKKECLQCVREDYGSLENLFLGTLVLVVIIVLKHCTKIQLSTNADKMIIPVYPMIINDY